MTSSSYTNDALAKYSKLVKATVSGDLTTVKELLKDENIDILTLIPGKDGNLTSAVALAIDSGNEEMFQMFLNSPQMDYSRSIGDVLIETVSCWMDMEFFVTELQMRSNVINYALFNGNFELAEELIKQCKCSWANDDFILAAHFYLKSGQVQKLMEIIVRPNVDTIMNLPTEDKMQLVNLFKYFNAEIDEIFEICFPSIEVEGVFEFWEWFYTINISKERFEKLKQKDLLKYLNVISEEGKTVIMIVAEHSLEKAKILYDFGADIHLGDKRSLICEAERHASEFLKLFPFTEQDFLKIFKCNTEAWKDEIVDKVLSVYPQYAQLLTLENVVVNPIKESHRAEIDLYLHYQEELKLKANSKIWLEILAQVEIKDKRNAYGDFENAIENLRQNYGRKFVSFLEANKGELLHLLIEKGRTMLAWNFARAYKISWNVLDVAGNNAFQKLLVHPQETCYGLVNDIDASLIDFKTDKSEFLHQPELVISGFSLQLICKICQHHNIDMFAPNPSTGESLLDRVLKQEHLDMNTGLALLQSLKSFNRVLAESQAQMFFTKCPQCLFSALECYSSLLPSNICELRDKASNEPLIVYALQNWAQPHWKFVFENAELFNPYMELMIMMIARYWAVRSSFWDFLKKEDSEKYFYLLKAEPFRSIFSEEEILYNALDSENIRLLQFAIEELGISPNTLIERDLLLRRILLGQYTCLRAQCFDYLVGKGAIACIEPIGCAYFDMRDSKWIERLVQLGYELQPNTIKAIKNKLDKLAEKDSEPGPSFRRDFEYGLFCHPRFSHYFTARDKSICLLYMIQRKDCYEGLRNAGADPKCIINSKGQSVLHLLSRRTFPEPDFFKVFNITEEDLTSKGQAPYSPIERVMKMYSDNLNDCPIISLYSMHLKA